MNVMNVEKSTARSHGSSSIGEHTQGRNPLSAVSVVKPFHRSQTLLHTRPFTWENNFMDVSVGRPSLRSRTSLHIGGLTLERSPMDVVNAGKPSSRSHTS